MNEVPSKLSSTCWAVGVGEFSMREYMDITMPGLQYPHWVPLLSARRSYDTSSCKICINKYNEVPEWGGILFFVHQCPQWWWWPCHQQSREAASMSSERWSCSISMKWSCEVKCYCKRYVLALRVGSKMAAETVHAPHPPSPQVSLVPVYPAHCINRNTAAEQI